MSEENNKPKKLSLSGSGKLSLGGGAVDPANLRGGMVGSGRGKTVQVEVRRKRWRCGSASRTGKCSGTCYPCC